MLYQPLIDSLQLFLINLKSKLSQNKKKNLKIYHFALLITKLCSIQTLHIKQYTEQYSMLVKLTTVAECDQTAPFSIATAPRCTGRRYAFPWIAPLYR